MIKKLLLAPSILLLLTQPLSADQAGFSDLTMHDGSGNQNLSLHIGEEADIYLHLDSHGELLTGFQLMLTLQENVLELIPGEDGFPFQQVGEGFFAPCGGANVLTNELQDYPELPGTQLAYIIQTGQGESPRPSCAGDTDILLFRVRALSEFSGFPIRLDQENHNFRNTLYWQAESNIQWDFNLEVTPHFTIADFAFFPPLPDLHLTTTAPGDTLDLYEHIDAFFCPDSLFMISYEVLRGDSAAVIDTFSTGGEEFYFIFNRDPEVAALMELVIRATPPDSLYAVDTMLVLCDDPPLVNEPLPDIVFSEDQVDSTLDLDAWVLDIDHADQLLSYTVPEQSVVQLEIDPVTHRAHLTPPAHWFGIDTVGFRVTDPLGLCACSRIPVTVESVNDPPQLTDNLEFLLYPGTELVLTLEELGQDPDHSWQELEWTLTGAHDSISTVLDSYEGTLRFFTSAITLLEQRFPYQLSVTDPQPLSDQDTLWITVQSAPPVISTIPVQVLHNGGVQLLYLDDYVTDADHPDGELSWSVSGNSQVAIEINSVTHVASLTASPYARGWEAVTFTAEDPDENSSSVRVTVVLLYDHLPQVAAIPDLLMLPGETCDTLDLDDYVWDEDNTAEEMTWCVSDPTPFQLLINPDTHQLTATAPATPGSWRDVTFFCFDPDSNLAGDESRLLVIDPSGFPLLLPFPELQLPTLSSSEPWLLDELVYDHDDPVTALSWSCSEGNLVEAELDSISRTVTFSAQLQTGVDSLLFTATDPAGHSSSAWWRLQITSGEAPQLAPFPLISLRAGDCATLEQLSSYVYDPDSPDHYLNWLIEAPDSVSVIHLPDADALQICSDSLFHGTAVVELTVIDNDFNSDSAQLVVVSQENIPPRLSSSILPNPAINEYLDLLLLSDEELQTEPEGDGNGEAIVFTELQDSMEPEGFSLYQGRWLFSNEEDLVITLTAIDLVGNVAHDTLLISSGYMQHSGDGVPGYEGTVYSLELLNDLPAASRCVMRDLSGAETPGLKLFPLQLPGRVRLSFNPETPVDVHTGLGIYRVTGEDTTWCSSYLTADGRLYTDLQEGGTFLLLTGDRQPLSAPTSWSLSQPRPNPFNPQTVFTIELMQGEEVAAVVYNLLGRQVAVLHDGYLPAGRQELLFDGNSCGGLASGLYFLRVESRHLREVRKMMLIK